MSETRVTAFLLLPDCHAFARFLRRLEGLGCTETAIVLGPEEYPCAASAVVVGGVAHVCYVYKATAEALLAHCGATAVARTTQDDFNRHTAAALYALFKAVLASPATITTPEELERLVVEGTAVVDQLSAADRDRQAQPDAAARLLSGLFPEGPGY